MAEIERYEHHGNTVAVFSDLKGRHRERCLCFAGCAKFKPGTAENCQIAEATFDNCVRFGIVTPVMECPEYEERPAVRANLEEIQRFGARDSVRASVSITEGASHGF